MNLYFYGRLFCSFFLIFFLEPQAPEINGKLNPMVAKFRSTDLFLNYKTAKDAVNQITWGAIFLFYFFHLR